MQATQPSSSDSNCARALNWCRTAARNCFCPNREPNPGKFVVYTASTLGAAFIPVRFLNGALAGAMLFMTCHETLKSPHSGMSARAKNRTWKHISAGTIISGLGWGLGSLASKTIPVLILVGGLSGMVIALLVAYSNKCCRPEQSQPEEAELLQPVVQQ